MKPRRRVHRASGLHRVILGGAVIVDTTRAHRVLETSHPPVYYVPLEDVAPNSLEPSRARATLCEWKGLASYFDAIGGDSRRIERAAWPITIRRPISRRSATPSPSTRA